MLPFFCHFWHLGLKTRHFQYTKMNCMYPPVRIMNWSPFSLMSRNILLYHKVVL